MDRLRSSLTYLLALALASAPKPASAQDAVPESAPGTEGATVTEDTSYSGPVALLYGVGYTATFTGFYLRGDHPYGVRIVGAIVLPSGLITTFFGPMVVHFDHGYLGKGLLSAGGQLAAVAVGMASGYGVASLAEAEEPGTAMLAGALSVHAGWALFDTLVLARAEQVVDRTIPAPTYALSLAPERGGGIRAGALFRF